MEEKNSLPKGMTFRKITFDELNKVLKLDLLSYKKYSERLCHHTVYIRRLSVWF
jgi:hypothetical protein